MWNSGVTPRAAIAAALLSNVSICGAFSIVRPISSRPLSRQCLRKGSRSNVIAAAIRPADFLVGQIDGERRIGAAIGIVEQLLQIFRRHRDRQDAVLEAVIVENVGEGRRDHAANAEIEQCPGRMLARRAAAEIIAGDQDLRLAIGRLVEHEFRQFLAVLVIAHLIEQRLAEPRPLDRLQELLRDDHVGIDIDDIERSRDAGQGFEFLHGMGLSWAP